MRLKVSGHMGHPHRQPVPDAVFPEAPAAVQRAHSFWHDCHPVGRGLAHKVYGGAVMISWKRISYLPESHPVSIPLVVWDGRSAAIATPDGNEPRRWFDGDAFEITGVTHYSEINDPATKPARYALAPYSPYDEAGRFVP